MSARDGIDLRGTAGRFSGNEARYRHLLAAFIEQGPVTAGQIRRAVEARQFKLAKWAAHAFEGRVSVLGLPHLHAAVLALEAALIKSKPTQRPLARVDQAIAEAQERIRAKLDP